MRLPRPLVGMLAALCVCTGAACYAFIVIAKHWSKP